MDHFRKAKKAIEDGLIGEVVWASGGFGRNRNEARRVELRDRPRGQPTNLDWKAFLGTAPKRAFDPERYFRWRKYWDYSGGIATDLFYHTVSPLLVAIGGEFPFRVTSSGGIYVQKDREVPDTFFMNVDYPAWTMQLACSVASGVGRAAGDPRQPGDHLRRPEQREPRQHARWRSCPTASTRTSSSKKTGGETLKIDVQPFARGAHPHMDNFLEACVAARSRTCQPNSATGRWRRSAWASRRIASTRCSSSIAGARRSPTSRSGRSPQAFLAAACAPTRGNM